MNASDDTQPNRPLAAAAMIGVYALVIGYTDNMVRVIAEDAGLWQFHAIRTAMVLCLVALIAVPLGLRLRPRNLAAVVGRSVLHGSALMVYFGSLAFLPVAQVAAGLFSAPIFVLVISRFAFGERIGPWRIGAVAVGFLGIVLVLMPGSQAPIGAASLMPVAAGALYALGNIATRRWCRRESAETLVLGFFIALGLLGLVGLAVLALLPPAGIPGTAGFLTRGWVTPTSEFWIWTFVQAAGSLIGVTAMIRGYQLAEASRVAIFEYSVLPAAALWGWIIWGEVLGAGAFVGMALIFAAGAVIALRGAGR